MHGRAIGQVVEEQPTFVVEVGRLRPGVPIVRVCGPLDRAAADELGVVVHAVLDGSPWAVILDLTAVTEIRVNAVPPLVDLAYRAGTDDIGLYLVTAGGAVDDRLSDGDTRGLFDINHSVRGADRALGGG